MIVAGWAALYVYQDRFSASHNIARLQEEKKVLQQVVQRLSDEKRVADVLVTDQKVVDGAVNEIAEVTGETGGLLRYVQSGRVQRYALLLFAAVGLLSLALLIANI